MKIIPTYEPFTFQRDSVNTLLEIVKYNHGACIFDETGLGKTITAATTAINLDPEEIFVVSPKSNQKDWKEVLNKSNTKYQIFTYAKPPTAKCDVLIIDEGHNVKNVKAKSFMALFELVKRHNPIVLILTATPFQNSTLEFKNVLSLINFKSNTPAFIALGSILNKIIESEKKVKNIDRFTSDDCISYEDISKKAKLSSEQDTNIEKVSKILSTFSIRNTRKKIQEKYASDVELMGHFPIIERENVGGYFNDSELAILFDVINKLSKVNFALQNSPFYSDHPRYRTNQSFGGLMKTFLLKRLDSSVYAFKKSVKKMIDNIEIELSKGTHTVTIEGSEFKLSDKYLIHLYDDKEKFEKILEIIEPLTDEGKLNKLLESIQNEKTVIFTEYKDTLEIINEFFLKKSIDGVVCYTSESNERTLEKIKISFDANNSQETLFTDEYKILITTDVLSEGVNLHAANRLVHFDQKWNPSKLTQRNGRIDRILKTGVSKNIKICSFSVEKLIEAIIELDKKISTKQYLGERYLKENQLILQTLESFSHETTLFYPTNESKRRYFECYRTYMGDILEEGHGIIGERTDFILNPVEIPEVPVEIEKYYTPLKKKDMLLYRIHPEFNHLYRDAWAELTKKYSKKSDPFDIDFLHIIQRESVETCSLWLHQRKYL